MQPNKALIFILIYMAAMTQAGLVMYTPAFPNIATTFDVSSTLVKTTLTAYLLGFGFSQLFYGPASDIFGRKKVLLLGLFIFSLGCLWSIYSSTFFSFMLSRIIQGIGIGSCMTLSRAIIRDSFTGKKLAHIASFLSSGFAIGLGLTPIIGGHILSYFSWRSEFVVLALNGMTLFIIVLCLLPETLKRQNQTHSLINHFRTLYSVALSALKSRLFLSYIAGGVFAYGVVIAYTTMSAFLILKTLHFSPAIYGWITCLIAIFYYLGTSFNRKLIQKFKPTTIIKIGITTITTSGLISLGIFYGLHIFNLYVTLIPVLVATFGQALIWSNCIAGALQDFKKNTGAAAAIFGCLQMCLSAGVSAILATLHEHNQEPLSWVIFILGLLALCVFYVGVFRKK